LAVGHGETDRVCTSRFPRPAPMMNVSVGRVVESCPPAPCDSCLIDAALVAPNPDIVAGRGIAVGIEASAATCQADLDAMMDRPVLKVGCVTGLTTGTICGVGTEVDLDTGIGPVHYQYVYEVMSDRDGRCFAQPGDSGAIVVDQHGAVVGMLVGMQRPVNDPSSIAYVVPIDLIIQELGISLIGAR
jgi:hypothetical protein